MCTNVCSRRCVPKKKKKNLWASPDARDAYQWRWNSQGEPIAGRCGQTFFRRLSPGTVDLNKNKLQGRAGKRMIHEIECRVSRSLPSKVFYFQWVPHPELSAELAAHLTSTIISREPTASVFGNVTTRCTISLHNYFKGPIRLCVAWWGHTKKAYAQKCA